MNDMLALDSDWNFLLKMFPDNWRELATLTKAKTRKLRNFANEETILRALLLHVATGYSLRETATRLKIANIASVSDVALLKRLQCSEAWFRELSLALLQEKRLATVENTKGIRMRLVDATLVEEPGKTGSTWRIHYSLTLPDLRCDYFKITGVKGIGTGESFKQFPIQKGDCIIGDRGYSTARGISYIASKEGYSLVRVNSSALKFTTIKNKKFDLLNEVRKITQEHGTREWNLVVDNENGDHIAGRLCVIRKTQIAREQAIKKLRRAANKKGYQLKQETEELAGYIILFTTLPIKTCRLETVLAWYRIRWQIELVFKRLKSLARLGHLPKQDEASARAWLYGKLFTGLLVEKLMAYAKTISPWGYV